MRHAHGGMLVIALFALAAVGCYRGGSPADDAGAPLPDVSAAVHLVVHNNSAVTVDVAVARGFDEEVRMGVVTAGTAATFLLDSDIWDSSPVAIVATPVSGFGAARSASLDVFAGNTITFTVEPDLRRSYATVR